MNEEEKNTDTREAEIPAEDTGRESSQPMPMQVSGPSGTQTQAQPPERAQDQQSFDPSEWALRTYGMTEDQLRQTVQWARQTAQAIQSGYLKPAQAEEKGVDFDEALQNWSELDPKSQAQLVAEMSRQQLRQEMQALEQRLQEFQRNQAAQLQLAMRSIKLASEAGVPFDEIILEATKLASMTPDQLLQAALEAKVAPKKMQQAIEQRVQEELARRQQQEENEMAQTLVPGMGLPRWMKPKQKAENPLQAQLKKRLEILQKVRKLSG